MKKFKMLILGIATTMAATTIPVFAMGKPVPGIIMVEDILSDGIIINGKLSDGKTYIEQGQTMIPLRKSAEALGFKVEYDSKNDTIDLDNGIVKTTLATGRDLYYKASCTAIGLTQSIPLGVAPTIIEGTTYVPASLYNLLYSNEQTVTIKENTVIISTDAKNDTFKKVKFTLNEKQYTLSLDVPSEVSEYVNLEMRELGEMDNRHIVLTLKFSEGDKVANIASFPIYTLTQYEVLKREDGPMPQELINNIEDNMVVTFLGLQSNPFEPGTEEAKFIDGYQANVKQMLETLKIH